MDINFVEKQIFRMIQAPEVIENYFSLNLQDKKNLKPLVEYFDNGLQGYQIHFDNLTQVIDEILEELKPFYGEADMKVHDDYKVSITTNEALDLGILTVSQRSEVIPPQQINENDTLTLETWVGITNYPDGVPGFTAALFCNHDFVYQIKFVKEGIVPTYALEDIMRVPRSQKRKINDQITIYLDQFIEKAQLN